MNMHQRLQITRVSLMRLQPCSILPAKNSIDGFPFKFHHIKTSHDSKFSHEVDLNRLITKLPPLREARELFNHFVSTVHPNLGILHIPSTKSVVEAIYSVIAENKQPSLTDILLVYSIFAGAAISWTPILLQTLGATQENAESAFETYTSVALSVLGSSYHTIHPSTTALSAIATLGHVVRDSDDTFPERALDLRIRCHLMCQKMQIHRLDTVSSREEQRLHGTSEIDLEIQRRIWWNMVATDW